MSEDNRRVQRVEKELRQLISLKLAQKQTGLSENLICISQVRVSPDLRQAKVYVSQLGKTHVSEEVLKELKSDAPDIQRFVHSRMKTRFCPKLIFFNDDSVSISIKMDGIFNNLNNTPQED